MTICITCYKEYGSPKVINDKVIKLSKKIHELSKDYITIYGHVVFEDCNYNDESIISSLNEMINLEEDCDCDDEYEILKEMIGISIEERVTAGAIAEGIIKIEEE